MFRPVDKTLLTLLEDGICAVIRHIEEQDLENIVYAIYKGGIHCIEITLNTKNAFTMIRRLASVPDLIVGAGTVMDGESARQAMDAGAKFIVSPHTCEEVLNIGVKHSILTIPGAFTPTEIVHAYQLGAQMIKVFPAGSLGPDYFHNIRGPLADIPLMATGGIGLDNIQNFIASGVSVIGIGNSLAPKKEILNGNWSAIQDITNQFVQSVQSIKNRCY